MIKALNELTDQTAAIGHFMRGRIAASEDGKVTMRMSFGHHSATRGDAYIVKYGDDIDDFFRLNAYTEEEAIEKANRRLERWNL